MNTMKFALEDAEMNLSLAGLACILEDDPDTCLKVALSIEGIILIQDLVDLGVITQLEYICPTCQTEQTSSSGMPISLSLFEDHECEWILNIPSMMDEYGLVERAIEELEETLNV